MPHPKSSKYAVPEPYPEIRVYSANPYYAELLMDDYAGVVSELTAITQYLYHHYRINDAHLSELLEGIATVEMKHMEMLAETISQLGGDPVLRGSFSNWGHCWSSSFIQYGNCPSEQIRADIEAEEKAISNYKMRIHQINDPYIQRILQRIIKDEEYHLTLFKQALKKI